MSELTPLLGLLKGHFGWLPTLLTWMAAVRLVLKPFNLWLQKFLNGLVDYLRGDGYQADTEWVNRILRSRWYRLTAFLLDYFVSIKLPVAPAPTLAMKTPDHDSAVTA